MYWYDIHKNLDGKLIGCIWILTSFLEPWEEETSKVADHSSDFLLKVFITTFNLDIAKNLLFWENAKVEYDKCLPLALMGHYPKWKNDNALKLEIWKSFMQKILLLYMYLWTIIQILCTAASATLTFLYLHIFFWIIHFHCLQWRNPIISPTHIQLPV